MELEASKKEQVEYHSIQDQNEELNFEENTVDAVAIPAAEDGGKEVFAMWVGCVIFLHLIYWDFTRLN